MDTKKGAILRDLAEATDVAEMAKARDVKPVVAVILDTFSDHAGDPFNVLLTDVINENLDALVDLLHAKLAGRVASLRAEYDVLVSAGEIAVDPEPVVEAPSKVVSIKKARAGARRR